MAFDSGLNRLIALGGTYNPSVVGQVNQGRAVEQDRQMNNLAMQQTQQKMGAFPEANRLANLQTRQQVAASQQATQAKQMEEYGTAIAPVLQDILREKDPNKQQAMYQQSIPVLEKTAQSYGVPMPPGGMPSVFDDNMRQTANMITQKYGPDQWQTRKRGDALTRVNQKTGKEERVLGASDATGVTKTQEIKPISDTKRRNLGKEFEISRLMDDLESRYKNEYSGFLSTNVGEMALAAGRRGFAYEDMADYMTEYQEWKNLVRNSLFGSQLTKPEMNEFEKTTINPAWTAKRNRKILARQKELLNRGKKRAIIALKAEGWTDEMIEGFEGSYEDKGGEGGESPKVSVDTAVSTEPVAPGTTIEMPDDEYQQRINQILGQ